MIYGIGTDITSVARMQKALDRQGERFAEHILSSTEYEDYLKVTDRARFLSKRFAAKEAFAKAFGTGLRPPATLKAISTAHDELGKPIYIFNEPLRALLAERGLKCHLTISDEKNYALAFAVIEMER